LNEGKDNVLVVCHALTGNSKLSNWWGNLLGNDIDVKFLISCVMMNLNCVDENVMIINDDVNDYVNEYNDYK
jgi:hypothetical protein